MRAYNLLIETLLDEINSERIRNNNPVGVILGNIEKQILCDYINHINGSDTDIESGTICGVNVEFIDVYSTIQITFDKFNSLK